MALYDTLCISDDMRESETLRERVLELERRFQDQNDEITCLRATLADALRRITSLESGKGELLSYLCIRKI